VYATANKLKVVFDVTFVWNLPKWATHWISFSSVAERRMPHVARQTFIHVY